MPSRGGDAVLAPVRGMILLPAIDILEGKAVRLSRGDFAQRTDLRRGSAADAAQRWVDGGARALHVVDLDGARSGAPVEPGARRRIAGAVEVPVQVGGGLRDARGGRDAI